MSDDSKPYRSGPPIKSGDRIELVCGDQRIEGTAQVESGPLTREQNIRIIPDGEPMQYGRDYTLGAFALPEIFADANLTFTAHRWLKGDPIPYDEMRRLCGLPDLPDLRGKWGYRERWADGINHNAYSIAPFMTWTNPFLPNAPTTRAEAVKQFVYAQLCESGVLPIWELPKDPFDEAPWKPHHGGVIPGGKPPAWMVDAGLAEPEPETPQQRALPRPSTTPPPWADIPGRNHRPAKTRNHWRVK
jgi:hypothetical protein